MKRDDVVNVQNAANNNLVFGIEDHACFVALVIHLIVQSVTPNCVRKSRTATTRYRSASLPGCGLCKVSFRPPFSNVTAEPLPSTTLQPTPLSIDSMRDHGMFPFTGSEKTLKSVFWWVLFTSVMIAL